MTVIDSGQRMTIVIPDAGWVSCGCGCVPFTQATVPPVTEIPDPPLNLTATGGNGQVILDWDPPLSLMMARGGIPVFYVVKFSTSPGGSYTAFETAADDLTATNYTHTGRQNGTTYYYIVTAVNEAGESAPSNQASATPAGGGGTTVLVPGVTGGTQAQATTNITAAGLFVGTVTNASHASIPAGIVISQSPTAGTSVAAGSSVNLVISTGPAVGAKPIYFGRSVNAHLNAGQVAALTSQDDIDYHGSYACGPASPANYCFVAWPEAFAGPPAPSGIKTLPGGFDAVMADASVGYGTGALVNGYNVERVIVNSESYIVYRLLNQSAGNITLQVP